MKKLFLSLCLLLAVLCAPAGAQFHKSESARKAGEKLVKGDHAGALAVLDKAIAQRRDLHEVYQMRGSMRGGRGDIDGAIADYTEALKITPDNASLYERRAMFRMFRRDSAGALQDFDAAIAHGLKTEKVYVGRAQVKADMGDTAGAIADYRFALAANPNLAAAHNGLAFTLERKGEVDAAIAHLQDFLDRYEGKRDGKLPTAGTLGTPTGTATSVKREGKEADGGQTYLATGEFTLRLKGNTPEEMERETARYEQLMNLASTYATLGRLYAKKNDHERALATYEKGLRINRDDFSLRKLRSEIRIERGDLPGAIEDLTVVVNSRMGGPNAHLERGLLLLLQGKEAEAEKEFALHRQMFPQAGEYMNGQIESAKKLRARQSQP
jgi:tetratricopeptide (TPR) repeat protein